MQVNQTVAGTTTRTHDLSLGWHCKFTLTANTTIAFSNVPATGWVRVTMTIIQDAGTARTLTWPSSIKWSGGTVPTFPATLGADALYQLDTVDGGTTWRGTQIGASFA